MRHLCFDMIMRHRQHDVLNNMGFFITTFWYCFLLHSIFVKTTLVDIFPYWLSQIWDHSGRLLYRLERSQLVYRSCSSKNSLGQMWRSKAKQDLGASQKHTVPLLPYSYTSIFDQVKRHVTAPGFYYFRTFRQSKKPSFIVSREFIWAEPLFIDCMKRNCMSCSTSKNLLRSTE